MPRPADEDLLHPDCMGDDSDIAPFYEVAHWRDAPDAMVEGCWAAPHFFSAEGWRHFAPAFMCFALRHAGEGTAAVQATVMNLAPANEFAASKLAGFDGEQLAVAERFVEEIRKTDPWPP